MIRVRVLMACAVMYLAGSSSTFAAIRPVHTASELQAAITAAVPGDEIVLDPGVTYAGAIHLPAKASGASITIRTSATLPNRRLCNVVDGAPCPAADVALLPVLTATAGEPAISFNACASNWTLRGLNLGTNANNVVEVHPCSTNVVFEKIYILGASGVGNRRGIMGNSSGVTLKDSFIANIRQAGSDSSAFAAWDGPGPYVITNNYLEAASENVLFGGADSSSATNLPANITVTDNYMFKPLAWKGAGYNVKNLFELKVGRHVVARNNIMRNNWTDGQSGTAVVFTPRNQDGHAPWGQIEDVLFESNVVTGTESCYSILGYDDGIGPTLQTTGITIRNTLCIGTGGQYLQIGNEVGTVVFDHNTYIQPQTGESSMWQMFSLPTIRTATGYRASQYGVQSITVTNNLFQANAYGIHTPEECCMASLVKYAQAYVWKQNVLGGSNSNAYPPTTYFPTAATYAALFDPATYLLVAGTPYATVGTDGKALGWIGLSTGPTPTPTPTPTPVPTPTPGVIVTTAVTSASCKATAESEASPDGTTGWRFFITVDGASVGGSDAIAPYTRSATITTGIHQVGGRFTKTGQTARNSDTTSMTCK